MQLTLPALPPFSFSSVVRSHGWAQLAPFGASTNGELTYMYRMDRQRVVELRIRAAAIELGAEPPDGWRPAAESPTEVPNPEPWMESAGAETGVTVEAEGPVDPAGQALIERDVAWMLGLDQDLSPFYAQTRSEPKLARAEARAQGRILRCPTLFEDAVKTMLTVNTSWAGTRRMVEALVAQFGDPLPGDATRRAFPTAEQIAGADEETLRSRTRLGFRAPSVLQLGRAVASGALELEALKQAAIPTTELRQRLLAIRGVGPYAAANLLMILGRYDFIPVDSWAMKMVSLEWHQGRSIGPAEVEAAFERWGEWKGLAYWLWDWSEAPA
jgi:3-methyladenine DNA glycosylase/8-oxoguanine DNA glycosylase